MKSKILDKIPRGTTAFNSIVVPLSFSPAYVMVGLPLRVFKTLRMPRLKAIAEKANERWIQKYLKGLFGRQRNKGFNLLKSGELNMKTHENSLRCCTKGIFSSIMTARCIIRKNTPHINWENDKKNIL